MKTILSSIFQKWFHLSGDLRYQIDKILCFWWMYVYVWLFLKMVHVIMLKLFFFKKDVKEIDNC